MMFNCRCASQASTGATVIVRRFIRTRKNGAKETTTASFTAAKTGAGLAHG